VAEALSQQETEQQVMENEQGRKETPLSVGAAQETVVEEYDFGRPNRVSKDQLKSIRTLHENFAEIFGFFLSSRLQTMATIELLEVNQYRYTEYMLSLRNPSCFYPFDLKNKTGTGLLELTPELIFVIVDRLLGGAGRKAEASRGITILEQRLVRPMAEQALKDLTTAWSFVHELKFQLSDFESNADFIQIAPASEIVIAVSFEVKIEEESFKLNLCYPSFSLEEVISKLNVKNSSFGSVVKQSENSRYTIQNHLNKTQMVVKTILGSTEISIGDLLQLQVGDVLVLDTLIEADLPVFVADRLKFFGRPGMVDNNIALKINRIQEEA